jgi:hypothetical protein
MIGTMIMSKSRGVHILNALPGGNEYMTPKRAAEFVAAGQAEFRNGELFFHPELRAKRIVEQHDHEAGRTPRTQGVSFPDRNELEES